MVLKVSVCLSAKVKLKITKENAGKGGQSTKLQLEIGTKTLTAQLDYP